jgi:hypothetical protein
MKQISSILDNIENNDNSINQEEVLPNLTNDRRVKRNRIIMTFLHAEAYHKMKHRSSQVLQGCCCGGMENTYHQELHYP